MNRRQFLASSTAGLAALAGAVPLIGRSALHAEDAAARPRLAMPPLLDTEETGRLALTPQNGKTNFLGATPTRTAGFNQSYLGPTLRLRNGPLATSLNNRLYETVTVHWHGLLVHGANDGGPHSVVLPGQTWAGEMQIAQRPATLWYHSHVCGRTAPDVYSGLAGMLQVTDGRDDERGLPSQYGRDDLTLIIQDRRFDDAGRMVYEPSMTDVLNGFHGNRILINGQMGATAVVPRGIVRLRLLNASNARIYTLHLSDSRPMFLAGTDGGLLTQPIEIRFLRMAPGERAEILVDFAEGPAPALMNKRGLAMQMLQFALDDTTPARITRLPDSIGGEPFDLTEEDAVRTRRFSLNLGGGSVGGTIAPYMYGDVVCGTGAVQGVVSDFGINGSPFKMERIDFEVAHRSVERWVIGGGGAIEHPFHVHGVHFRVLSQGGGAAPRAENRGWKDTVVINGETEILARFDHAAGPEKPFMFHCHILEHEDAGMMGQFCVV